jgi:hypothetical protein
VSDPTDLITVTLPRVDWARAREAADWYARRLTSRHNHDPDNLAREADARRVPAFRVISATFDEAARSESNSNGDCPRSSAG